MITLKPPALCPCCGAMVARLSKSWERFAAPSGKVIRYPAALEATYHCGAAITARFVVQASFSGHLGGAKWRIEPVAGCLGILDDALTRAGR